MHVSCLVKDDGSRKNKKGRKSKKKRDAEKKGLLNKRENNKNINAGSNCKGWPTGGKEYVYGWNQRKLFGGEIKGKMGRVKVMAGSARGARIMRGTRGMRGVRGGFHNRKIKIL
ncbi:9536_t:CDS:1 [Entrophospora sp. SA101]|nr:9536_t:CDS:1 [Entrophospora sp. SA101]CAJ0925470.1 16775_t:CDS:1 [Entrophospora sp. SA101]